MFTLYGRPRWGSVIVEAQLAWYGLPVQLEEVGDLFATRGAGEVLRPLNPLAQIPTLILPDGAVMTESAAITLLLADLTGRHDLVPEPASAERAAFLRWLIFLVANIYPTFTYTDDPSRFVADPAAQEAFDQALGAYRERLWRQMEAAAGAPWFLGARFTALDIYIAVMTHWRPRRAWFAQSCPRLAAVAAAPATPPELAAVWRRAYPPE